MKKNILNTSFIYLLISITIMDTNKDNSSTWKETSLPNLEKKVIKYWRDIDAINCIIENSQSFPELRFLEGAPFCNGTMHFGHILVSTVKDTMARFFAMNGYYVDRRNGFDCHGVPCEMLAKKTIGYTTKEELLKFGIDKHNDVCRSLISNCAEQWYKDFERLGRWIDQKREFKTMDVKFMESVIWVFSELYTKGMIFEGIKVMPYSTGCGTPLSHFEAKQNYKDVTEMSVTCCFEIVSTEHSVYKLVEKDYPTYILAWTTTPWTLPMNSAICTGINIPIIYAFDTQLKYYIMMSKNNFETTYSKMKFENKSRFIVKTELSSNDLVNMEYKPPFDYFWKCGCQNHLPITERAFRVVSDAFVKGSGKDSGTGFVHCAAAYGEEDFRVCCEKNIIDSRNSKGNLIDPVDDNGCFTNEVPNYTGMYVKTADKIIIADLKSKNLLFDSKQYTHSYPFCYRTDTPLLYKVVNAWFLNASNKEFRNKMLANAKKINWFPKRIGEIDFCNWLQNSVDWCISRTRYWGTPIPVWKSADGKEIICIKSIAELEELSGVTGISDLHIEVVDKIQIPSREGRGMLSRVEGVLDCWFESGSTIYGQQHYPFEGSIDLSKDHLSDFVSESADQYRCWFYVLNVLSTALFDKPAFANVIVTGMVNGSDGQKMSKSKGNYPDPNILMDKYGADILRLYLLSTPVVKAESVRFDELALSKLQQNSTVKIYNIGLFLVEKINLYDREYPENKIIYPTLAKLALMENILDKWIISKTGLFSQEIYADLSSYQISGVAGKILNYIEQLTNWYVKMARERLKGPASKFDISNDSWKQSIETLLFVLHQFIRIVAPVLPFICETVYLMLTPYLSSPLKSIHFCSYPKPNEFVFNMDLENKFNIVQQVITLIREGRDTLKINHRRPIGCVEIGCLSPSNWVIIQDILDYVRMESNVLSIKKMDPRDLIYGKIEPIMLELSAYLKEINQIKNMKLFTQFITNMTNEQIHQFQLSGCITEPTTNVTLNNNHISFKYLLINPNPSIKFSNNILVRLDATYTPEIKVEYLIRLINTAIQMHRKQILLKPWQVICIMYHSSAELQDFITEHNGNFCCKNLSSIQFVDKTGLFINGTEHEILDDKIIISSVIA